MRPKHLRALKCIRKVFELMPMAVTHTMLKANFLDETKPHIELMAENIRRAFNDSIEQSDWIDNETKQSILDKSNAMKIFVGAPKWIDDAEKLDEFYAGLEIDEESHFGNIMNCHQWQINRKLKTLDLVGNVEWPVNPSIVGAYHFQGYNAVCLYLCQILFISNFCLFCFHLIEQFYHLL